MDFETIPTDDPIVSAVIRKMYQRSQVGIKKYGTTMERNDLSFTDWVTHLQEDLMDSIIYLEKLKHEHLR
jgi:acyl transferase domain-containing protein